MDSLPLDSLLPGKRSMSPGRCNHFSIYIFIYIYDIYIYNILYVYIFVFSSFFSFLWLELAVSLPPSQLDSDKILAGLALFKLFLLWVSLVKNMVFYCISK